MSEQTPVKKQALDTLRLLARHRATLLLQWQDQNNGKVEFLPTTEEEIDSLAEVFTLVLERERHEISVLINREIDTADSAKDKKISAALHRLRDEVRARSGETSLALAT